MRSSTGQAEHRFKYGLRSVPRVSDPRMRGLAIELLCNAFPTGAAVLDAQGRLIFANREGEDLLAQWRKMERREHGGAMPAEIVAACEQLRRGRASRLTGYSRPKFGGRIFLRHPEANNLSAVIALERSPRDRRLAVFCILIQDRLKDSLVAGRRDQLAMLTLAERRVAKLVADGLRNEQIASALCKSVPTVKSQLAAIFAKLHLESRTQLVALLRTA